MVGNKIRVKKIIMILAFFLLGLYNVSYPADFCNSDLVRSWELERDQAVVRLIKGWLNREPRDVLDAKVLEVIRKETYLATCSPPFDVDNLYSRYIENTNHSLVPVAILKIYLNKNGISLDPRHFFEGRQFCIERGK